jgi:hypothetical protein
MAAATFDLESSEELERANIYDSNMIRTATRSARSTIYRASGNVRYAVMSLSGFLGRGRNAPPWDALKYHVGQE